MIKTVLILIFTIIVVPLIAYEYGAPLTDLQEETLMVLVYTCLGIAFPVG